jgi:hypothetical protein
VYATQEMYKSEYTNIGRGKLPINQFNWLAQYYYFFKLKIVCL